MPAVMAAAAAVLAAAPPRPSQRLRSSLAQLGPMQKISSTLAAMLLAAALGVAPATARADCGDPGQDPCAGPVPTVEQVVAVMAHLTDPNIPAANKTNVVTPGFDPDDAGTVDDHLNRLSAKGLLPLNFVVTDIRSAPANFAGATLATTGLFHQTSTAKSIVLVDQDGHWLITQDTAMRALDAFWDNGNRRFCGFVKAFPIRCPN
jgi:hypothetical protein